MGRVVPPPNPCSKAFAPASVTVGPTELEEGATTLRLRDQGEEDRYRLVLTPDSFEISPLRVGFSLLASPPLLLRAPADALHVRCTYENFTEPCRERAAAGGPTCETFFADPVIAEARR